MITKTFEVRDRATFIPVLAIRLRPTDEADRYLIARAGYGTRPERQAEYILVVRIAGGEGRATCDPYDWGNGSRTLQVAHDHIAKNFDGLPNGAVVDVEYILGETAAPKVSESQDTGRTPWPRD